MRRQWLVLIGLCVSFASPIPLAACLWDSDTLATESRGMPEAVKVITGRFERNPPLYYEMRLARVSKELETDPSKLELYDDAGVACDRLGRDDEAIGWMEKKAAELDKKEHTETETTEQRYRYHANLGTFLIHRWFKHGADRSRLADLSAGRDHIARAIEINPDAHFGREKYQLKVIDWILKPPPLADHYPQLHTFLDADFAYELPSGQRQQDALDAVRGLSGLIVLGNAWESVDVYVALLRALDQAESRTSLARLARLRVEELIDDGKKSLDPGAPVGEALKEVIPQTEYGVLDRDHGGLQGEEGIRERYHVLRAEADDWQARRTEYLMKRLKEGRHPDTDPTFWNDYQETPPPSLGPYSVSRVGRTKTYGFATPATMMLGAAASLGGALLLTGIGVVVWFVYSGPSKRSGRPE